MGRNRALHEALKRLDRSVPTADEMTRSEYLCPDGKAQIDVLLREDTPLFDPLTYGRQRDLDGAIYELIDRKLYTIPLKYPVRVCFHGPRLTEREQQEVRDVLREHYLYALRDKKEDLRINQVKAILLGLFGAALLSVYFALEIIATNPVFMEFLSIAGWVAAWEAVDCWLLERKDLRLDYLCVGQAAMCEVTFQTEPDGD